MALAHSSSSQSESAIETLRTTSALMAKTGGASDLEVGHCNNNWRKFFNAQGNANLHCKFLRSCCRIHHRPRYRTERVIALAIAMRTR